MLTIAVVVVILGGLITFVSLTRTNSDSTTTADLTSVTSETSDNETPGVVVPPSVPSSTSTTTTSITPRSDKVLKLSDHPLLQNPDAGLPNLGCELPTWGSSQTAIKAFFTAATACLDQAWAPILRANNLPFSSPQLSFPTGTSFSSDCGTVGVGIAVAAYYCEGTLYFPFRGLQTAQYGNNPGVYLALIAHEYGHHVQELSGMMDALWQKIYAVGEDTPAGQEWSRRKELQAQCFSGMFLSAETGHGGTITAQMYQKAWNDQQTRGDDTSKSSNHGTNAHYAGWWRAGAQSNRIASCNTFTASSADVR